jgi:hypothetical protein
VAHVPVAVVFAVLGFEGLEISFFEGLTFSGDLCAVISVIKSEVAGFVKSVSLVFYSGSFCFFFELLYFFIKMIID